MPGLLTYWGYDMQCGVPPKSSTHTRMHTYPALENLELSKWLLFRSVHWILYSKSIFAALGYVNNIKQDQLRSTSVHERVPLSTNGGSNGLAVGAREDTTVVSWCHVFYGLGTLIKYENKPKTRLKGKPNIFWMLVLRTSFFFYSVNKKHACMNTKQIMSVISAQLLCSFPFFAGWQKLIDINMPPSQYSDCS